MAGRFNGNQTAYSSYRPRKHRQHTDRPETKWMLAAAILLGLAFVVLDVAGVF